MVNKTTPSKSKLREKKMIHPTKQPAPKGEDMPNPSKKDLDNPMFNAIWEVIKSWDVNVPKYYKGYCGANGSHVMLILEATRHLLSSQKSALVERIKGMMVLHKHDSIPSYTADLEGGCSICIKNQALTDAIRQVEEL